MIFSLTTLMTSSKNLMWNFAWYKTMHQSLEFEQWFFFLWEKSYSIFLSISFLFLPFYILWFLFYASQPSSVGKPLPVRPSAARDPASPLDRGLLGVDRTARGESRLRRKSCLTAAISRSAGSTDGSDEADVRKLRQKLAWRPTASSGESRRPERQISSLTASAQRPQIQRPPCRSRTLAMYAGVHSSVRPQHSQAANSTSAVTAATESATLITVADMTKNESGDLKAREKKPWTAWNKKERCIARSISLSIYRFGGSDGDEMGVDGQTATSPTQQQRQRLGIPSLLRHLPLLPAVSPCLLWVKRPSSLNQDRDQNLAPLLLFCGTFLPRKQRSCVHLILTSSSLSCTLLLGSHVSSLFSFFTAVAVAAAAGPSGIGFYWRGDGGSRTNNWGGRKDEVGGGAWHNWR